MSLAEDPSADQRSLLVLYGSQTGSAQDVAELIARQARRRHFRARVHAMDDYDRSLLLGERYIVFVAATTGQGVEPSNMRSFWRALRQANLPSDFLCGLEHTTFGLGDSSYPKYNWTGKKLHRRLMQLGSREFYPKGEADDQNHNGIDATLDPWLEGLWSTLLSRHPLPLGKPVMPMEARPPARLIVSKATPEAADPSSEPSHPPGTKLAVLRRNTRVTADDHFQDTRELELEFGENLDFVPGAVAELRPENLADDVQMFLDLLKWASIADEAIEIRQASQDQPMPSYWHRHTTLRHLFTSHLDIFSVPRRSFFEWLSYFTSNPDETEKLRELCSTEGQEDLHDYAHRPRRTIYEVLTEFRSARIPVEYVADIFPEIRPRQFSIASSAKQHPRQIHLLVAIVKYQTRLKLPRRGVCTAWISQLKPGACIPVSIATGAFWMPSSPSTPVLCIGPGTGIAPFRSLAQERACTLPTSSSNLIVFGCRSATKDFYYRAEWEAWERHGKGRLHWCASRDQKEKIYVQDEIMEHSDEVWECVGKKGGWIYISGSAGQMPKSVRKALGEVWMTRGSMTEDEAGVFMSSLEKSGRLQEETWS